MFIDELLPAEGLVCVAKALNAGGFKHYFFEDRDEAQAKIASLDEAGATVYLAQATFKDDSSRKQTNALALRNFFLDIDCGPEKPYPSQREGAAALKAFCDGVDLPYPCLVNSGNGLYAHWLLDEAVPAEAWKQIAYVLKGLCAALEFHADPMRTADSSSVLRPPGAHNRKDSSLEKQVTLVRQAPPLGVEVFADLLRRAGKKYKISTDALAAPKAQDDINADFYVQPENVPSSALRIAEKCQQVKSFAAKKGNVSEPLWYAMLGLLRFTVEAPDILHDWSSGHPDFSPKSTQEKIQHHEETGVGPTTCAYFGGLDAHACLGCKHTGKIKSPILLGRADPEPLKLTDDLVEAPDPFRVTKDGLFYGEDDRWTQFYDQKLYPVRLSFDESLGYEVVTIKHHLPHEGEMEFTLRSAVVNDPKAFHTALWDNHVKVVGKKEKKCMEAYMESYMQKLQRQRRMSQLMCQMGWKTLHGEPAFALGQKVIYGDRIEKASFAKNVPQSAQGFRTQGEIAPWIEATEAFAIPGMEPLAFAFLAGAFGAPLMKFTGYDGAIVSTVGKSGIGKTLVARWIQSTYGKHNELMMLRDDTKNALVSRLGVYGNLPLTIDEVTNIDGPELSDLAYRITQGRDKARLTKQAVERASLNGWNTLAVVSSNASLVDKLSHLKIDASAEINRIFEFPIYPVPGFTREVATGVYRTIDENYGLAGEIFIQDIVRDYEHHRSRIDKIAAMIDASTKARDEERFWSAVASAAIYGGLIAQRLGLIRFEVAAVLKWVSTVIRDMRGTVEEIASDACGVLGQYIDEHATGRLLVEHKDGKESRIIDPPRAALVMRQETDTMHLYISRADIRRWIALRKGSYTNVRRELKEIGALKDPNRIKTLGAGTFLAGAGQSCWMIDLKCRALGHVGLHLVQEAKLLGRAPAEQEAGSLGVDL